MEMVEISPMAIKIPAEGNFGGGCRFWEDRGNSKVTAAFPRMGQSIYFPLSPHSGL
jgi:hypothetical protein